MADPEKEKKLVDDSYKKINDAVEANRVGQDFYESVHERGIHHAKWKKIKEFEEKEGDKDKGFAKASAYFRTKEGQTYLAENIPKETVGIIEPDLGKMPDWKKDSFLLSYAQNPQALAALAERDGIRIGYNEAFRENAIKQNLTNLELTQDLRLGDFDDSALKGLIKQTGADKYLTDLEGITKGQTGKMIRFYDQGARPPGPDYLRSIGLEDKLKDMYKKK